MSTAAWPTPPFATSPRRWRVSPTAGGWSRSPARTSRPTIPAWRDAFVRLQERGRVVFSAAIDGAVYAKHGTTIETRLTVIDKRAGGRPGAVSGIAGHRARRGDVARLGRASTSRHVARSRRPRRADCRQSPPRRAPFAAISRAPRRGQPAAAIAEPEGDRTRLRDGRLDAARGQPAHRCAL